MVKFTSVDLEVRSLPYVATSVGPNARMFELLGLENSAKSYSNTYWINASVSSKMA